MPEHKTLAAALVAAQGEFPPVIRGKVNPHFRSKYADLGETMAVLRPVLAKNGIAYTQSFVNGDGVTKLRTVLIHGPSGEKSEPSDIPIFNVPQKIQDLVAMTTYLRRLGLFSILGVTPEDEDDDGEQANNAPTEQRRQQPRPPQRKEPEPGRSPEQEVNAALAQQSTKLVQLLDADGNTAGMYDSLGNLLARFGELWAVASDRRKLAERNADLLRGLLEKKKLRPEELAKEVLVFLPEKAEAA